MPHPSTVLTADPDEVRAIGHGFLRFYLGILAAGLLWAIVWSPENLVLVAVFAVVVAVWWRRVRRTPIEPPVLVVSSESLRWEFGADRSTVRRDDLALLEIRRRNLGRVGCVDELTARDRTGNVLLRTSLWDRPGTVRALRQHAWPVQLRS